MVASETHTSCGALNPHARMGWEDNIFGHCYRHDTPPFERPKYVCDTPSSSSFSPPPPPSPSPSALLLDSHLPHPECTSADGLKGDDARWSVESLFGLACLFAHLRAS